MNNFTLPSSSKTSSNKDEIVLAALENGSYHSLNENIYNISISDIKAKIIEFSQFLNSVARLSLLRCEKSACDEFVFLLLTLKKSMKYALGELGHSRNKEKYNFMCSECNECIDLEAKDNFWDSFQDHEHCEMLYYKFLNGTLPTPNIVEYNILEDICDNTAISKEEVETELNNENADSGVDNENCEPEHYEPTTSDKYESNGEEEVNNFRFNFVLRYNDVIEHKIYPDGIIKAVKKVDKIKDYTIQRAGQFRAVCLLCPCDIVTRSKVSKMPILDHVMGQRHLRNAAIPANIDALKLYHEVWLNLELNFQAHQVFFRPDVRSAFKCVLCNQVVNPVGVVQHIQLDLHKKKVLDLFEKNSNLYYLSDLQALVYGVTLQQVEAKGVKKEKEVNKVKKRIEKTEKTDSDSSPSSETKEVKHNIIKAVENPTSTEALDLLPNRYKNHLRFLKNNGNMINCEACAVTLAYDIETVKKHIRQLTHTTASKIKVVKYIYYCEICNVRIIDENLWQRHFTIGPNNHKNIAESRKNKITEYECTKCCVVIYGDDLSLTRHLSVAPKREKRVKELKLPEQVKKTFKSLDVIENLAFKLANEANDMLKYNQLTMECCKKLENTLNSAFEGCKVYPFGSRISGFGNLYSDLDVFVDVGDMYTGYKNQDALAQVQLVRKAAGVLSKQKDEFLDVIQIPTARTPIIKLYHISTDIECDLSFRHGLSVENTKFLRFCIGLQPITQPFVLLLKKWSEQNILAEHITTYALVMMAIFYLQINNYLFSVKRLRELNPQESRNINGWETLNYTAPMEDMKALVELYPHNVYTILKDFFGYYAKFSYPTDVVCPLLGHTIKKSQFYEGSLGERLPEEMKSYVNQLQNEEHEEFRAMSPFCIQDPFDLSHNLTKACQPGTINKFKNLCDLTFKHLEGFK